jgi:predicted flap endonuclease-1-like 5' DNA nuclease
MPDDAPVPTEYPHEIGTTARRTLALNGYTTFDQLTRVSQAELLALHGVGPKAIRILTEHLAERGLSFRSSS